MGDAEPESKQPSDDYGIPAWNATWTVREFEPDEFIEEVSCRYRTDDDPGPNWQGNRIVSEQTDYGRLDDGSGGG